jgi:hypothetical protein
VGAVLSYPFGETATLLIERVTGTDSDGNDVSTEVEVQVPGSVFAPTGSTELIQGQDTVIQNPTYYLGAVDDAGQPVAPKATDKVRRPNGDVYDIDGEPQVYPPNPFSGDVVGPVLRLERVTG